MHQVVLSQTIMLPLCPLVEESLPSSNIGKHLKLIAASILYGVTNLVEVDYTLCYFFFMSSIVYLQLCYSFNYLSRSWGRGGLKWR